MIYEQRVGDAVITIKGSAGGILTILQNTSVGDNPQDTEEINKIIAEKVNQLSMKTLSQLHLEDE